MKTCRICGETKPLNLFPKASTCVDGHRRYCKVCESKKHHEYYLKNKDRMYAASRKWALEHKEESREHKRRHRQKAAESGTATEYRRRWRRNKPLKAKAEVSARRKKYKQATPPWVHMPDVVAVYVEALEKGMTVDHIVPIRGKTVSGLHVPWNLQIITIEENVRKRTKYDPDTVHYQRPLNRKEQQ